MSARIIRGGSLVALGTLSGLTSSACTDFDLEERIEDMRVLAVTTEPAELLTSPLFLTPASQRPPQLVLPTADVDVEVFAYDPRGGRVRTALSLCPADAGDSSCRLYDPSAALAALDDTARAEVEAALAPQVVEGDIGDVDRPLGRTSPSTFRFAFTPAVIDFLQNKDDQGQPIPSVFPLLPRFVVESTNLDIPKASLSSAVGAEPDPIDRERAFKRLPLSLDLTSTDLPPDFQANLADGLGVKLCGASVPTDGSFVEGDADCLFARIPNRNPDLAGFRLETTDDVTQLTKDTLFGEDPDLGRSSLLRAGAGDFIALTPMFRDGSVENYQVLSFDIEASKIKVVNRIEDLGCEWFTTRGAPSNTLTAVQFIDHLGVVWQLPPACSSADGARESGCAKTGERDSLVLVVRDQRGGTTVADVTVEYR